MSRNIAWVLICTPNATMCLILLKAWAFMGMDGVVVPLKSQWLNVLMEKDKEKHKGHSTVMTIYTNVSKTGGSPAHVWQVYGWSVPGPDLDNLRSWKEACSVPFIDLSTIHEMFHMRSFCVMWKLLEVQKLEVLKFKGCSAVRNYVFDMILLH